LTRLRIDNAFKLCDAVRRKASQHLISVSVAAIEGIADLDRDARIIIRDETDRQYGL
jgi:hypothetical protein